MCEVVVMAVVGVSFVFRTLESREKETWKLRAGSMWTQRTREGFAVSAGTENGGFCISACRKPVPSLLQPEVKC